MSAIHFHCFHLLKRFSAGIHLRYAFAIVFFVLNVVKSYILRATIKMKWNQIKKKIQGNVQCFSILFSFLLFSIWSSFSISMAGSLVMCICNKWMEFELCQIHEYAPQFVQFNWILLKINNLHRLPNLKFRWKIIQNDLIHLFILYWWTLKIHVVIGIENRHDVNHSK